MRLLEPILALFEKALIAQSPRKLTENDARYDALEVKPHAKKSRS